MRFIISVNAFSNYTRIKLLDLKYSKYYYIVLKKIFRKRLTKLVIKEVLIRVDNDNLNYYIVCFNVGEVNSMKTHLEILSSADGSRIYDLKEKTYEV